MKKLILTLLLVLTFLCLFASPVNAQFAGGYRSRHSGPLEAQDIKYENALVVQPDKYKVGNGTLQGAYDWLKSSARDGQMGALSAANRRTLFVTSGYYEMLQVTLDTDYVNIMGVGNPTIRFTNSADPRFVITADETEISGVRLEGQSGAYDITYATNTGADQFSTSGRPVYRMPRKQILLEERLDAVAGWTAVAGAIAVDSERFLCSQTNECVKLTPNNSGVLPQLYKVYGTPMDFRNMSWGLSYYVHSADAENIQRIKVQFWDAANNYREFIIFARSLQGHVAGTQYWHDFTSTMSDGYYADSGAVDLSGIDTVVIYTQLISAIGTAEVVSYNNFRVWDGRLKTPLYSVNFDDGWANQREAAAYCASKGVPVTIYVCGLYVQAGTNVFNGATGLNLAKVKEMQRAGHLIANHAFAHTSWQTWRLDGNERQLLDDMIRNYWWMVENGFGLGARMFASPGGGLPPDYDTKILGRYCDQFRYAEGSGNADFYGSEVAIWDEFSEIKCAYNSEQTGLQPSIDALVGTAAKFYLDGDRNILINLFHQIDGTAASPSLVEFKAHIDIVAAHQAAGRLRCVTMTELMQEMEYAYDNPSDVPIVIADGGTASTKRTNHTYICSGAATVNLHSATLGQKVTVVRNSAAEAKDVTIDPLDADNIDGDTAGDSITNTTDAIASIELACFVAGTWTTTRVHPAAAWAAD